MQRLKHDKVGAGQGTRRGQCGPSGKQDMTACRRHPITKSPSSSTLNSQGHARLIFLPVQLNSKGSSKARQLNRHRANPQRGSRSIPCGGGSSHSSNVTKHSPNTNHACYTHFSCYVCLLVIEDFDDFALFCYATRQQKGLSHTELPQSHWVPWNTPMSSLAHLC